MKHNLETVKKAMREDADLVHAEIVAFERELREKLADVTKEKDDSARVAAKTDNPSVRELYHSLMVQNRGCEETLRAILGEDEK